MKYNKSSKKYTYAKWALMLTLITIIFSCAIFVAGLENDVQENMKDITNLNADVKSNKKSLLDLNIKMDAIVISNGYMKDDVSDVNDNIDEIKDDISTINSDVSNINGKLEVIIERLDK